MEFGKTLEWNWGMEFKTLQVFGKSVKVLTLVTGKLNMHFIISKVTTKSEKRYYSTKIWSEKKIPHQSKRRQDRREKDGTSKHTKKDGRQYIQIYQ